jgi:hypothetical protein
VFHSSLHLRLAPGPPVAVEALIRFCLHSVRRAEFESATRLQWHPSIRLHRFGCIQFHRPQSTLMWSPEVARAQKRGFHALDEPWCGASLHPARAEKMCDGTPRFGCI